MNCTTPLSPVYPTRRSPDVGNKTFALIHDLMEDMLGAAPGQGMFPDAFVHLGGDEVCGLSIAHADHRVWCQRRGTTRECRPSCLDALHMVPSFFNMCMCARQECVVGAIRS